MRKGFGMYPSVRFNRSRFDLSHGVKTSMSVGKLYPLDIQEVLPGDTFKCTLKAVARVSSSFIKPVMDNCYLDLYHFFIPLRLVFDDAEKVFGVANPSSYTQDNFADMPNTGTLGAPVSVYAGTVADYLGLPPGAFISPDSTNGHGVSIAPFRAFAKVYNEWFRNENTCDEVFVHTGACHINEAFNNNAWSASNYTGQLPSVGKKKDYFTSCLPSPQKGSPVRLPLAMSAPVFGNGYTLPLEQSSGNPGGLAYDYSSSGVTHSPNLFTSLVGKAIGTTGTGSYFSLTGNKGLGLAKKEDLTDPRYSGVYADLSGTTAANVNDLRLAFQLQKMLERDALYGSRYNEYLLGHFGVTNPDSRLQFTEYLGGGRIPIEVQQVAQTAESTSSSPLGNVAGYSLSNGYSKFSKGFTEHGYILTVGCIRTFHTYQQGVSKLFSRVTRNDFYDPLFANLGEQPVYESEIYVLPDSLTPDKPLKGSVFGYNEAWAEYRYIPNRISGQLRSGSGANLDFWHFGDNYSNEPVLSQQFTDETPQFFDRTVTAPSTSIDNFICDFYFDEYAIRVMPTYSVPGLIDHH